MRSNCCGQLTLRAWYVLNLHYIKRFVTDNELRLQLFRAQNACECLAMLLHVRRAQNTKQEKMLTWQGLGSVLQPNSLQEVFVICYDGSTPRLQGAATAQVFYKDMNHMAIAQNLVVGS